MIANNPYGRSYERNRHPSYLSYLEISITEHCNLNCARCSNFSPLAKDHFADLDIFKQSIIKLAQISAQRIDEIRLIGGEPLLNPDIIEYFEIIRLHLPKTRLSLFTNGILLPEQSHEFYNYIETNNVRIFISDYFDGKLKEDILIICNLFNLNDHIRFIDTAGELKEFNNIDIDIVNTHDSIINYNKCSLGRTCLHMRDDRIYICPIVAHIDHFNKHFNEDLKLSTQDFIDIADLESLEELIDFVNEPKDDAFCKNCDLDSRNSKSFKMKHTDYDIYEWYKKN